MKGMVFKGNDEPVVNMNKTLAKLKADSGKRAKSSPFQKNTDPLDEKGNPKKLPKLAMKEGASEAITKGAVKRLKKEGKKRMMKKEMKDIPMKPPYKRPTGPRARVKEGVDPFSKKEQTLEKMENVSRISDIPMTPGYEDPPKIQKTQREGITPHSQKMSKIAKGKSKKKKKVDPDAPGTPGKPGYEPPVKRSDLDEKGKKIWDSHRKKKK